MSRYELLTGTNYHDLIIEVGFAESLFVGETIQILQIITDVMQGDIHNKLDLRIQGVTALSISESTLLIQFRLTPTEDIPDFDHEDCVHRRVHFVFYLFARIDERVPLGDIPFPEEFRAWIKIADEYDLDTLTDES